MQFSLPFLDIIIFAVIAVFLIYRLKNILGQNSENDNQNQKVRSEKVRFLEIPVSMDYPSKKNYSKIRPILDWYIIAKYWIKGIFDKSEL